MAIVIMIVNYDRKTFIVQATDSLPLFMIFKTNALFQLSFIQRNLHFFDAKKQ
jgi:hypothetical protein